MSFDPDDAGKEIRARKFFGGSSYSPLRTRRCKCGAALLPHRDGERNGEYVYDKHCTQCLMKIVQANQNKEGKTNFSQETAEAEQT